MIISMKISYIRITGYSRMIEESSILTTFRLIINVYVKIKDAGEEVSFL